MDKMKKRIQVVIALIVVLFIIRPNVNTQLIKASEVRTDADKLTIDLLLEEGVNINEVINEIKKIDSKIQITQCDEILLLHLELPKSVSKTEIVNNRIVKECVQYSGNLPEVVYQKNDISKFDIESVQRNEEEKESSKSISDKYIFDAKAWHVNEVTQNKKSLELSTGRGTKIAMIDSGVDYYHPILAGKINMGLAKSYVTDDTSILDRCSHGTMTAGLIAQIAPDATITSYKVIGESSGNSLWLIKAIIDATNDDNDIINISLGTYKYTNQESEVIVIKAYERALRYAMDSNVIVVASAGNDGIDLDEYKKTSNIRHLPGDFTGVNTVSSVRNQQLASYSNYGSCVQYCAPGGDVVYVDGILDISAFMYVLNPTYMDNGVEALGVPQGYTVSYGTSLSAPIVSAGLADILSYCREKQKFFKVSDVEKLLEDGAIDLGEKGMDSKYGKGEINIYNSLLQVDSLNQGTITKLDQECFTYHTDSMDVTYRITSKYGNQYNAIVDITNTTQEVIHDWSLAFNSADKIESIWNGEVDQVDDYTVITNKGYNQDINPGATVEYGYTATMVYQPKLPDSFILINDEILVKDKDVRIKYDIDEQWDTGYIASITIQNISTKTINDWKLDFYYAGDIQNIWNANILKREKEHYWIINDGQNQNIEPGESVVFHYTVSNALTGSKPTDYTIINVIRED